jgi:signal transduction histidine kinase
VTVRSSLEERLPEAIEAAAYYVVAEALANTAKHARASHVEVRLTAGDGALTVEVSDDGIGGASLDAGTGLRGLRDRIAALGGSLDLTSAPGTGTRLRVVIPCAS